MIKYPACFLFVLTLWMPLHAQPLIESSDGLEIAITDASRIITLGGSVTETVFALGFGDQVIATDESSTYPPSVFSMPRLPYLRNMTSEGALSLGATLIISSSDANPASAIQQIRDAGTDLVLVREEESMEGVIHKLSTIGKILGAEEKASELIKENEHLYRIADSLRATLPTKPKILFVLSARGGSTFMVAGNNTGAQKIIELAGGQNAFDSFEGYKVASNEAILASNPDFILVMESRLEEVKEGIKNTSGINIISAAQKDQIIGMDGNLLLGFGPRFGSAILQLMELIHPETTINL
ncbi:MAG: ABC transporter substrate-binding protein [Balneolales bacterium]|nr:ABC transporter substrate-binding protein [Balneolales bacterium]